MFFRIFIVYIGFAATSYASNLTLDDFLQGLRQHPQFIALGLNAHIARVQSEGLKGSQDYNFQVNPNLYYEEPVGPSAFLPTDTLQAGNLASLQKNFWNSGTTANISHTYAYNKQSFPDFGGTFNIGSDRFHQHRLLLTLTQPLLQNFGGALDKLGYDISKYTQKIQALQSLEAQEDFLLNWAQNYLNWVYAFQEILLFQERVALAKKQLQLTQQRFKAGISERVDILQSREALNLAQQSLLQSETQFKNLQSAIAITHSAVKAVDSNTTKPIPSFDLNELLDAPTLSTLTKSTLPKLRSLQQLQEAIAMVSKQSKGQKNQNLPALNLNFQAGLQSGDPNFSESPDFNQPILGIGLQFQKHFGNRLGRNKQKEYQLKLKQAEKDLQYLALETERHLVSNWNDLAQVKELVELNTQNLKTSASKIKEEQRLFRNGRRDLSFVIRSQDVHLQNQLQLLSNLRNHHLLNLQLKALSDVLLAQR